MLPVRPTREHGTRPTLSPSRWLSRALRSPFGRQNLRVAGTRLYPMPSIRSVLERRKTIVELVRQGTDELIVDSPTHGPHYGIIVLAPLPKLTFEDRHEAEGGLLGAFDAFFGGHEPTLLGQAVTILATTVAGLVLRGKRH
jgi:hypothetical protein